MSDWLENELFDWEYPDGIQVGKEEPDEEEIIRERERMLEEEDVRGEW